MRVLIFHGYLLRGTGSNVYNASLAQALARLGHEVHLLCQDREAGALGWVDRIGTWENGELRIAPDAPSGSGTVTAYVPDIGGLLPVFVHDEYEGFEVKTFAELSDAELDRYLGSNVTAVNDAVEDAGGVDAALANHLVMGPAILARAGLGFAIKVHGSDLSYTVIPDLDRFGPFAEEGVRPASGVMVGSRHIFDRLGEALAPHLFESKTRLGPPGVDTTLFHPVPPDERPAQLHALAGQLRGLGREEEGQDAPQRVVPSGGARRQDPLPRAQDPPPQEAWSRDLDAAADAVEWFAAAEGARVVFVGKLIVSKGVDLLLAAWPLVHQASPGSRLLVVGFGEYRQGLERLWGAIASGDLETARQIAARGRALEGGEEKPLRMLGAFLDSPPDGYADTGRGAAGSVALSGRLEHDEVGMLVPASNSLVFPSTFPEAFGMVAAEAAAAGVLPVSADHSGAAEVSRELAAGLPAELADLVSFPLSDRAVEDIAGRLRRWLELDQASRTSAGASLRETASRLWSWDGVARHVLAASAGNLDELPAIPPAA